MVEGRREIEHRLYPIGAFSEKELVAVFTDPLCGEKASIDELLNQWRAKCLAFERAPSPELDVQDSELLPLPVKEETMEVIESVLRSYRYYLPPVFDIALVPIQKLVTPQASVSLEQVGSILSGAAGPISDDENASLCLGPPRSSHEIEAAYLGSPRTPPYQNGFSYLYQFSSEDRNMRFIPIMTLKPVRDMDLATEGSEFPMDVKAIPIAVGSGLPIVHILKVPRAVDPAAGRNASRLIISNGIHRIFRLSELGNTHVAAMVQTMRYEDLPNPFIDAPRDQLFVPKPLTISTLRDRNISRVFEWKKSKRVIKLQVTVNQEGTYVS
jgi:hypothetical protein